jgi:NADH-quinone oxidoreductase subunit L
MTAFYMFRLVSMTFLGAYRGPAWEAPAHDHAHAADDHGGHGHGPWHGPHESPKAMTFPLMALAVGAIVAGLVGIPAALLGGNAIEHFLEPSFTAHEVRLEPDTATGTITTEGTPATSEAVSEAVRTVRLQPDVNDPAGAPEPEAAPHVSRGTELGLMAFSVLIAAIGILLARKFYVSNPELSEQLAERWAGAHRLLSNKYYVDEVYNATIISGTMASARGLWAVDRHVVDGAVNGSGRVTMISSWFSGLTDRTVVDGLVNLMGRVVQEGSLVFRRLQTGLVQNYLLIAATGAAILFLFLRWIP